METVQRDARSSDETWVIGVVLAVFVSILVSASTSVKDNKRSLIMVRYPLLRK